MRPAGRDFTTRSGEPLDAANLRRDVKAIVKKAGPAAMDEIFAQRREPTAHET
ncbi:MULTISPECIES: hypothetical protein [unclassified Streptomyces]|uniref:hypothetical protein n=1 Tax=unclassified Streptomyces TaxID=2593676 RepID=UPI00224DBA27|nr:MULTISPECIES: hypothetical protein [unclassified Streptomyces]MCX5438678.1 hypothetical protein [Streptomyces sp. NBC_00063]WUB94790.1 hypothetical protein OHO83_22120 [Streptomyces sp. NBC_00569]